MSVYQLHKITLRCLADPRKVVENVVQTSLSTGLFVPLLAKAHYGSRKNTHLVDCPIDSGGIHELVSCLIMQLSKHGLATVTKDGKLTPVANITDMDGKWIPYDT
ncbi:uncharacterized protein LOC106155711 [Lingula anatina]|uniref:Uncharacterized protein LOC106155711 n=1 Tax=Lingula anatina TaxID=7574 RepID=A0A1S3HJ42_LINAN|nr:uncharacterized protein LOC106155711 [Lingula anatina]|eukprot:XP_013386133.1 uncharacterized protein LOC106155711 [Lingula anatina]